MANTNTGSFIWYEHLTKDPQAAIAFYSDVAGWKTQPFNESGTYQLWLSDQGPLGGVMKLTEQNEKMGLPPHWMGNVQVDDVDASVALAMKLGAHVHHEPSDIPTVGRYAVITDPQGAVIGLYKPSSASAGHDTTKAGEISWNELLTSDSAAAFEFYSRIFGWKLLQEMDMGPAGTYRIGGIGDTMLCGMMTLPQGAPMQPTWVYYVETSDLDAGIGRATKNGGKVLHGPSDVPGGGRFAQLLDPQAAIFGLLESAKK